MEGKEIILEKKSMRIVNKIGTVAIIIIAVIIGIALVNEFKGNKENKITPKLYDIKENFTHIERDSYFQNVSVNFNNIEKLIKINIPVASITKDLGYNLMNLKITLYDDNKKELYSYINYDDTFINPQEVIKNYEITFNFKKNISKEINYISIEHTLETKPQRIDMVGTTVFIVMISFFTIFSLILLIINIKKIKNGKIVIGRLISARLLPYRINIEFNLLKILKIQYFIDDNEFLFEDQLLHFFSKIYIGKKYKVVHNDNQQKTELLTSIVFYITAGLVFLIVALVIAYNLLKLLLIL